MAGEKKAPPPAAAKAGPDKAVTVEIPPPPVNAELRTRLEKGRPLRFEVGGAGALLGRDETAGVPIESEGVSRGHARIEWDGKGWWVKDLGSTNGTFVNGVRIRREKLQHLDVISLGRRADIIVLLRSAKAAPAVRKGIVRAALVGEDGVVHEIAVGEITLGRSAACNVVVDGNPVSKVHARVERSSDQLLLEDLASSNGSFVNGSRVRTAVLRDGDTLDLAGEARFKVVIEQGDVMGSGAYRVGEPAKEGATRFSKEWKTRFQWDSQELAAIAAAQAVRKPEAEVKAAPGAKPPLVRASALTPVPPPAKKTTVVPALPKPPVVPAPAPDKPTLAAAANPAPTPDATPAPAPAPRPIAEARFTAGAIQFTVTTPGRFEVGRAPTAAFRIDQATVSRRHVAIMLSDDRLRLSIEDLGAQNGTRVNGFKLKGSRDLAHADILALGEVRFLVAIERS
jgi:pSer/pThr/pTyr-binding forkhead associated (FHA) protein